MNKAELIIKLKELTKEGSGATQAEIDAATAKIADLMAKYNLTDTDITSAELEREIEEVKVDIKYKAVPAWYRYLATELCAVINCRLLCTSKTFYFVGNTKDTAVCEYLFVYFSRALAGLARENKPAHRSSYLIGAVDGVMRNLRQRQGSEQADAEKALVVHKEAAVNRWLEQKYPDLKTRKGRKLSLYKDSLLKGVSDGESIPINQGVNRPATVQSQIAQV